MKLEHGAEGTYRESFLFMLQYRYERGKMKALYRKYRPTKLSDVVGQSQVTDVLERAINDGKISHAYLFIGTRGTGKTSVARIFAHAVNNFNYTLEDHGAYITLALPNNNTPLNDLLKDIDEEVVRLQTDLISEAEYTKLQNQFENSYISANSKMIGVAENLANGYSFHDKNTNEINEQLDQIKTITREEIREVARKYLNKNQRVVLYYLPKK